jgi:hypothetical protein
MKVTDRGKSHDWEGREKTKVLRGRGGARGQTWAGSGVRCLVMQQEEEPARDLISSVCRSREACERPGDKSPALGIYVREDRWLLGRWFAASACLGALIWNLHWISTLDSRSLGLYLAAPSESYLGTVAPSVLHSLRLIQHVNGIIIIIISPNTCILTEVNSSDA